MIRIAWQMLVGDRVKYLSLVIGISFGILLITQQASIFLGIMNRSFSMLNDMQVARVWVMDPGVQYPDDLKPMKDPDLLRVRSVPGVEWAVPLFKAQGRARTKNGEYQSAVIFGLDSASLVGGPDRMREGRLEDLWRHDAVVVDGPGAIRLGVKVGDVLELNDKRAEIVGIADIQRTFQSLPVLYTTYSRAQTYTPSERHMLSFILSSPQAGVSDQELARRIREQTGLGALTKEQFAWRTVDYYRRNTGIVINFGITVFLGFLVGLAVAAQTFYTFVHENLRNFGALKAMGASSLTLVRMVLFQAMVTGLISYGIGVGGAVLFGKLSNGGKGPLAWYTPPELLLGAFAAMLVLVTFASVLALRKVIRLEPGIVFK
jgi:putative ABC transport system permease protein